MEKPIGYITSLKLPLCSEVEKDKLIKDHGYSKDDFTPVYSSPQIEWPNDEEQSSKADKLSDEAAYGFYHAINWLEKRMGKL
jgi:hypothetical protein